MRTRAASSAAGSSAGGAGFVSAVLLAALGAAVAALLLCGSSAQAADCPNAAIRAAQGPEVEALPDCMALEMVSPAAKYVQNALRPSVSVDGERVLFASRGALGDTPGLIGLLAGDRYVASRSSAGWSTQPMSPPAVEDGNLIYTYDDTVYPSRSLSPDFSQWVTFAATSRQYADGTARFFQGGLDGSFSALSPLLVPVDSLHMNLNTVAGASLQAVSADHGRVYFSPGVVGTAYLAGDPSPSGTSADANVYVARLDADGEPSLELLTRDGAGTVWGGGCGARVGGFSRNSGRNQGAVSADGGRVLFMTRPTQTGAGVCNPSANRSRIMERVEGAGGPQIGELFVSECVRAAPACSTVDGDDLFQGASIDGERVYFTSTRQLADSDLDAGSPGTPCSGSFASAGCDLYLYDSERPAGDRLVQVSAGDAASPTPGDGAGVLDGIAAVSADGSHAYFVATGVLTSEPNSQGASAVAGEQNLYSVTYDAANPDGRIAFVGVVSALDELSGGLGTFKGSAWPVPVKEDDGGVGDGRMLVFRSAASLTADDTDGGRRDFFRYDSASGDLERVSRAAPGGSDNGAFDVGSADVTYPSEVGTSYAEFGRWVSDDADSVVFTTAEGLVPGDSDGAVDSYVVRDEVPYLLPGTRDTGYSREVTPAVSRDGRTVAFVSFAPLLGTDGDTVLDIYVARVDGGFEEQLEAVCDPLADECRGTGTAPLDATSNTGPGGASNFSPGDRGRVRLAFLTAQRRKALAAGRSAPLMVRVSGPGRVDVSGVASIAGKRKRVIRASAKADRAVTLRVPVRLTARGRSALRNGGRLAIRLTVSFSDAPRPAARTVRLALAEKRPAHSRGRRR